MPARERLDADLERVRRDQVIELELAALDDLVTEPDGDAGASQRGPLRPGVNDLASTLLAARRLPGELTVRVLLPEGSDVGADTAEIEEAFRRIAADRSSVAWREGMAQRAMGFSQLPLGMVIAAVSWVAAYLLGYLATAAEGAAVGLLAVSAMSAITVAWVVSWIVVEATMLGWRLGARQAAVYDLLARARVEVAVSRVGAAS